MTTWKTYVELCSVILCGILSYSLMYIVVTYIYIHIYIYIHNHNILYEKGSHQEIWETWGILPGFQQTIEDMIFYPLRRVYMVSTSHLTNKWWTSVGEATWIVSHDVPSGLTPLFINQAMAKVDMHAYCSLDVYGWTYQIYHLHSFMNHIDYWLLYSHR